MVNEYNLLNERQVPLKESIYKLPVRFKVGGYGCKEYDYSVLEGKNKSLLEKISKLKKDSKERQNQEREERRKIFLNWPNPSQAQLKCLEDYVNKQDS